MSEHLPYVFVEVELSSLYEKRVSSFHLTPELFNRPRTDIATTRKSMTLFKRLTDFIYPTLKVALKSPTGAGTSREHSD